MLTTGISLAVLTAAGFYMLWRKTPARMRKFMIKHALFTDAVACGLTYLLFGGTIIGLFAAAFCGIIVSIMLAMVNNPKISDFLEKHWIKVTESIKEITGLGEQKPIAEIKVI